MQIAPVSTVNRFSYAHRTIIDAAVIMGIVGNLKTMQLEELLQWLSQSKKNGTLQINNGKIEKKIFFKEGRIISSASTNPEEYLGHFLVSHGLITEIELAKAIELQEQTHMLLGKILVTTGAIEEKELHRLLRLKAEESIYNVFSWGEGEFRFLDDVLPESALVPMNLDVTAIVLEGVQRVDEWRRIRKVIPTGEAIPVAMAEMAEFDAAELDPGARQILELVNDERTVEEIQLQTHSSEYHVCRVLFEQYQQGRLKIIRPRWKSRTGEISVAMPAIPVASAPPPSGNGEPLGAPSLLKAAQGYMQQKNYEQALRHLRAAKSLDPESKEVQEAMQKGEKTMREELERAGVTLTSVPKLAISMDQLTTVKISPQEGFMLTRINGSYDIQSIVKITPMPQLDALLVFWKLHQAGHIKLEVKRK
jgi:tetratricopeptide (TPR) repeat protein